MEQKKTGFSGYVTRSMAGMLGLSCYILADTYFVSAALGARGLTALNLAISLYSVISALGLMLGVGGGTRYSIARANPDRAAEGGALFSQAATMALGLGAVFLFAGIGFSRQIAGLLGASADVLADTAVYIQVIFCFAPFFLLNNVTLGFVRNDGAPALAMAAMLSGSFLNILLDWVFLFPLQWGMFGAAFATGLAPICSLGVLSSRIFSGKAGFLPKRWRFSFSRILPLLAPGLSSLVTELSSAVTLLVFNYLFLYWGGDMGVAAYGVVANLALVALALFSGASQGMQPLVSFAYGRNDRKEMGKLLKKGLLLALALAAALFSVSLFFAPQLTGIFNSQGDPTLASLAERGLVLYFGSFFFAGCNLILAAFFSASGRERAGFCLSLVRGMAALIPLALLFSSLWGTDGIWISVIGAECCAFVPGLLLLFQKGKKEA
jgi:Na+-driven multidrug efflux pump